MMHKINSVSNSTNNENNKYTHQPSNNISSSNHNSTNYSNIKINNVEQLILRLCSKIASLNNLNSNESKHGGNKLREEFINTSYAYLIKLFCSDAYTPTYDAFEISQKIKKNLTNQNRIADANVFTELEAKLAKLRIIKDRASILQFFLIYFVEQSKYESISHKNSLYNELSHRIVEAPRLNDNTKENLVDKSSTSKRLFELFNSVNEGFILRELIYALQGIDGKLFQKDSKDNQSMVIKVDMEKCVRMQVMRLLEFGWLYLRLRKFLTTYNNSQFVGLVLQAFCAYISAELKENHRLLAVLESQLGNKDEGADCGNLTLRRLHVWLDQPLDRLKYLNIVCDAVKDKKGGVLLSALYSYSIHGDLFKASLLRSGLAKCAIPIRDMIIEWICDGQIRDIHEEFFVSSDNTVSNDRLWHDKYNLRASQIPTFISEKQARKILVIGKSINYLRVICNEQKKIKALKNIPSIEGMLDQKTDTQFQDMIDSAYVDTSTTLMQILMKKYKLLEHFNSLKRYLLLGQGDFIRHLMDLMEVELNKPAKELMVHNLQRLLDKAITETNAQYDPSYIISCLEVHLLPNAPNDVGWDIFSLEYNMDGPLKTIFNSDCFLRYSKIFNFLWRVKRMEYTTCATWRSHKADMEKFRHIKEIYEIVHMCHIISSEMLRLVQNINFYIMFEVLEVSWKELSEKLNEAKDMDDVIAANETFLDKIISQLLLDPKSSEIFNQLRTIFNEIVKMSNLSEGFYNVANREVEERAEFSKKCSNLLNANNLTESELDTLNLEEQKRWITIVKPRLKITKTNTIILKNSFNEMVKKLLDMLKNHPNESLRFLSFRFNFNEYYN